jgi:hypothetical protein
MSFAFEILRPDDLLALHVEAVNLKLAAGAHSKPRLVIDDETQPALLIFHFQPQSIAEQAFFQTDPSPPPAFNPPPQQPPPSQDDQLLPPGSVGARMSGDSRLVFRLPNTMKSVQFDVATLLDWTRFELVLTATAAVPPGTTPATPPAIAAPGAQESALEIPYRLLLSPTALAAPMRPGWRHASQPVTHNGRAELWHTRLVRIRQAQATATPSLAEISEADPMPLRAVWSPDFVASGPLPTTDGLPFRPAMTKGDRDQIVILTSGFSGYQVATPGGDTPYSPTPILASKLFLSTLGGWLSSNGTWPDNIFYRYIPVVRPIPVPASTDRGAVVPRVAARAPPTSIEATVPVVGKPILPFERTATLDLVAWRHVATQGRDHYVRIVYDGYLYPFGHKASLIKVTERSVKSSSPPGEPSPVAYLRQRMFIVVREFEKSYAGAPFSFAGREMPLNRVRIDTKTTPNIDPPSSTNSFWVDVGTGHFPFKLTGTDIAGKSVDFHAPLIFMSLSETSLANVQALYAADDVQRRCDVRGHNVAYADPSAGDTAFKTTALYFDSEATGTGPPWPVAPFLPVLYRASVTIPSVSKLLGRQVAVLIGLYQQYLTSGMDAFAGVFAFIADGPPALGFSADKSGGFATPNISLTAVSARKGLISGEAALAAAGKIKPSDFFGAMDARLFGVVPLGSLIPLDDLVNQTTSATPNAPTIRNKLTPNQANPTAAVTFLDWAPQLQDYTPNDSPVKIEFNADANPSALTLEVAITRSLDGSPPGTKAVGKLSFFRLSLLGVVAIKVKTLTFTSQNHQKTIVVADLSPKDALVFEGPLAFIQTLAQILPPDLFGGKGPSITVTSDHLSVSYTLGLPPITVGVFSLQNIAIMTGLDLPWLDGKPGFEFGFASRGKPFLVTVEIFGGGGFVHLIVNADGVQMVEGAIEFGANFAFSVGVASGAVHAMAGIYFQLKGTSSDLTGFIDIGGEVSVLGIISISLDLNISLSWLHSPPQPDFIDGKATLTISVHIIFFSISVSLSVEKKFKAGGGDPQVWQLMNGSEWSEYAAAFA